MGVTGSTAPASGMEHAISHLLEMAATATGGPASPHGTQVGVASITAAATWAHVRDRIAGGALDRPPRLPDPDRAAGRITAAFAHLDPTGAMAAECLADYASKLRLLARADPFAALRAAWPDHEAVLGSLLAAPQALAAGLRSAGLPVRYGDLPAPVDDATARWAVANCALQRRRFGVADLAMLLGAWEDDDIDAVLARAAAQGGARRRVCHDGRARYLRRLCPRPGRHRVPGGQAAARRGGRAGQDPAGRFPGGLPDQQPAAIGGQLR